MVLVYTFGPISGGHLNPAVTFAVLLQEKMSPEEGESQWREALKYVIAQCAGGSLAGLACGFMVGFEHSKASLGPTRRVFGWLGMWFHGGLRTQQSITGSYAGGLLAGSTFVRVLLHIYAVLRCAQCGSGACTYH